MIPRACNDRLQQKTRTKNHSIISLTLQSFHIITYLFNIPHMKIYIRVFYYFLHPAWLNPPRQKYFSGERTRIVCRWCGRGRASAHYSSASCMRSHCESQSTGSSCFESTGDHLVTGRTAARYGPQHELSRGGAGPPKTLDESASSARHAGSCTPCLVG